MAAYEWKSGARIKVSAQTAGEECEKLAQRGLLTARALLDASRPEEAPLHAAFEWNDAIAAEEYRLSQSRHIISCLVVVPERKTESVRAFFTLERNDPRYLSTEVIMQDEDKAGLLLKNALGELSAFQRKYAILRELVPVFDAIEFVKMDLSEEQREKEQKGEKSA